MSINDDTLASSVHARRRLGVGNGPAMPGLVVVWSRDEPHRIGEVVLIPPDPSGCFFEIGRSLPVPEARGLLLECHRQRPGARLSTGGFTTRRLSRRQLRLRADMEDGHVGIGVHNIGRRAMIHNGVRAQRAFVRPGDTLSIERTLLFLCVMRSPALPEPREPFPVGAFGTPDAAGMVGESPAMWRLRTDIAFVAPLDAHVFIRGPSGSGKELVARAIHALSPRAGRPLVAQSCVGIPESLIEAEFFGNIRNYPNPGTPERPGLIGAADGSTLFLDEFGELPPAMQARLLRVMDAGEYLRLGDATPRRSDLRVLAATNRDERALKHDVFARLKLRIMLPSLNDRREDIPLLLVHLLRMIGRREPALVSPFFPGGDLTAFPRVEEAFVHRLVTHVYRGHVRELEAMIWEAIRHAQADILRDPGAGAGCVSVPLGEASPDSPLEPLAESAVEPAAGKAAGHPDGAPVDATATVLGARGREDGGGCLAGDRGAEDRGPGAVSRISPPPGFTERDWNLVLHQRRHGFSATACARDERYPGGRTGADFHLRVWICVALEQTGWNLEAAAALLEGCPESSGHVLVPRIRRFIRGLSLGLEAKGMDGMRAYLRRQYAKRAEPVFRLLDAIAAGEVEQGKGEA